MSTTIEPTVGRIVWYRHKDGATRAAIVVGVNSTFNLNLYVFGYSTSDLVGGMYDSVTHADPEQEPGCLPSWHWMPYQKQQAEKAEAKLEAMSAGASSNVGQLAGAAGFSQQQHARFDALSMALRTPGLNDHYDVLKAAAAYQAHIEGEKTTPAPIAAAAQQIGVDLAQPGSDATIEQEIVAKGKTAPRVTPADIEANIWREHYFTAAEGVAGACDGWKLLQDGNESLGLLTFCVLVLQNGFTVTGESACASPENFDAEIGRKVARQNAVQKIWPLMGYALKQGLYDLGY